MTKQNEHLIFGSAIVALALFFLWYYEKMKTSAIVPTSGQYSGTPTYASQLSPISQPIMAASQSVTPGVTLKIGGSPTYLTYNIPPSLSGILPNTDSGIGVSTIATGATSSTIANEYQGCCSDANVTPKTMSAFINSPNVAKAAIDSYNNLQSTGLLQ